MYGRSPLSVVVVCEPITVWLTLAHHQNTGAGTQ